MRKSILFAFVLAQFSLSTYSQNNLGFKQRDVSLGDQGLNYLYKTRDGILQGLDNLSRKACLNSRVGWSNNIIEAKSTKISIGTFDEEVLEEKNKGVRLVLPFVLNNVNSSERLRSYRIKRMLETSSQPFEYENKKFPLADGDRFARKYYNQTSCLSHRGIENACLILSGKETGRTQLKAIKKKLESIDKGAFIKRFSGDIACQVFNEKTRYMEVLRQVQKEIDSLEKSLKSDLETPDRPSGEITKPIGKVDPTSDVGSFSSRKTQLIGE